jgi:hypothetical protein
MRIAPFVIAASVLVPVAAQAQTTSIPVSAPAAEVPAPPRRAFLDRFNNLEWKGFKPTVGTVASGSGPAVGFEFLTNRIGGFNMGLGVDAMISLRNYQDLTVRLGGLTNRTSRMRLEPGDDKFTTTIRLPSSDAAGWALYVEQRYRRLPSLSLYGNTAPDETVRTDFGQTVLGTDAVYQLQTISGFGFSARVGYLKTDPFPGTYEDRPNTETVFSEGISQALSTTSRYIVAGIGTGIDRRDDPHRPKRGSVVAVTARRFMSREDAFTSFSRVSFDIQSFKQIGTLRHVAAVRLLGSYTGMTADDRELPFQLTHSLGGSDILRSFPSYRFRGQSLTAATVESRWRLWRPVDFVLFADFGHFERPPVPTGDESTLRSIGFGARYWFKDRHAVRADFSHGQAGWRLVATLGAPF